MFKNAQEIGSAPRWVDVGVAARRGTDTLDNNAPQEICKSFSNGALPVNLWAYLASALMYPFHKKLQEERT